MTEVKFKDEKVWIAVIIVIIIALGFFAYITYKPKPKPEPANVEVTSVSRKMGSSIDEVVALISIFNHGNSGTVTVWVELKQDHTWKKAQTVSIDSREPMDLTFVFSGLDPYQEIAIKAWIEA